MKYLTFVRAGLVLGLAVLPATPQAAPADAVALPSATAPPVPDEIPVALQSYVAQYFEAVRKSAAPPAPAPKK